MLKLASRHSRGHWPSPRRSGRRGSATSRGCTWAGNISSGTPLGAGAVLITIATGTTAVAMGGPVFQAVSLELSEHLPYVTLWADVWNPDQRRHPGRRRGFRRQRRSDLGKQLPAPLSAHVHRLVAADDLSPTTSSSSVIAIIFLSRGRGRICFASSGAGAHSQLRFATLCACILATPLPRHRPAAVFVVQSCCSS